MRLTKLVSFLGWIVITQSTMGQTMNEFTINIDPLITNEHSHYQPLIEKCVQHIKDYAIANGWPDQGQHSIINHVEVYANRARLEQGLLNTFNLPPDTKFPPGLTAANNSKDMLLIMTEEQSKIHSPAFVEPGFYDKMITHELAHLLHVAVLNGDENKMGPIWFFEGFAVVVSKQMESYRWTPSRQELMEIMEDPNRGDYLKYATLVRMLLQKNSMKTLVEKASDPEFNDWCLNQLNVI